MRIRGFIVTILAVALIFAQQLVSSSRQQRQANILLS